MDRNTQHRTRVIKFHFFRVCVYCLQSVNYSHGRMPLLALSPIPSTPAIPDAPRLTTRSRDFFILHLKLAVVVTATKQQQQQQQSRQQRLLAF